MRYMRTAAAGAAAATRYKCAPKQDAPALSDVEEPETAPSLATETAVEDAPVPRYFLVQDGAAEAASVPVIPDAEQAPADDWTEKCNKYVDGGIWLPEHPVFDPKAPWRPLTMSPEDKIYVGPTNEWELTIKAVRTMEGENWFNTTAVFTILSHFSLSMSAECRPHVFDPDFFSFLRPGGDEAPPFADRQYPFAYYLKELKRFTGCRRPLDIFAYKHIVIPVNRNGNHWCAIVIRFDVSEIVGTFIDSRSHLGNKDANLEYAKTSLMFAFQYLDDEHWERKGKQLPPQLVYVLDVKSSPLQSNKYDCGPFMIAAVQLLVCGPRPKRELTDMPVHVDPGKMARFREVLQFQCMTNQFRPMYAVYT